MPRFVLHTLRSQRQLRRSAGFRAGCFARQELLTFWTITVWADEPAMRAFRNGGDHARAMRHLMHWCDEASYAHFDQPTADLPAAQTLFERLRDSGKLSKVLHPSVAHQAGDLAGKAVPQLVGHLTPRAV